MENIKKWIKEHSTQEKIAEQIGVSGKSSLNRMINNSITKTEILFKLHELTGLSFYQLLDLETYHKSFIIEVNMNSQSLINIIKNNYKDIIIIERLSIIYITIDTEKIRYKYNNKEERVYEQKRILKGIEDILTNKNLFDNNNNNIYKKCYKNYRILK